VLFDDVVELREPNVVRLRELDDASTRSFPHNVHVYVQRVLIGLVVGFHPAK
jgi:hypothetical protein